VFEKQQVVLHRLLPAEDPCCRHTERQQQQHALAQRADDDHRVGQPPGAGPVRPGDAAADQHLELGRLELVAERARDYARNARAVNTLRAYRSDVVVGYAKEPERTAAADPTSPPGTRPDAN
jgi:hypothetical protein